MVVNAVGVGVGIGSLLPGVCISPPEASMEVQINTMVAKRKHRSVFIVLDPFGVEQSGYQTAKSLSVKIITSIVADATIAQRSVEDGADE